MGLVVRRAAIVAVVCLFGPFLFDSLAAAAADNGAPTVAQTLYAYAGGTSSPVGCPSESTPSLGCSLTEALAQASPGAAVLLAGDATYYGNYTVSVPGTSASEPVDIEPAPGVSNPILDGDYTAGATCSTTSCTGAVLTVDAGVNVNLSSFTIQDADNTDTQDGGGIYNQGILDVSDMTVSHDYASSSGGGIDTGDDYSGPASTQPSLTVESSTFSNDSSGSDGGAIDNGDGAGQGTVTIFSSTFSDDSAAYDGGAIDNADADGTATVNVTASTFFNNAATYYDGGAIDNGDESGDGTLNITTSTFSVNSATIYGAAVANGGYGGTGTVTIVDSTLDANPGLPALDNEAGTLAVGGSIVADSADGNCTGAITDDGYNLEDDSGASCGFSSLSNDIVGEAAGLTTLSNAGGATDTFPLQPGSPAIDVIPLGTSSLCPGTAKDQRGVQRPQGSACDLGAYEYTALTVTAPSPTMIEGHAVPRLTPIYSGYVTPLSRVTTPATCITSATSSSPDGTYPVTCSGAVDPDYSIFFVAGTLTIRESSERAHEPHCNAGRPHGAPRLGSTGLRRQRPDGLRHLRGHVAGWPHVGHRQPSRSEDFDSSREGTHQRHEVLLRRQSAQRGWTEQVLEPGERVLRRRFPERRRPSRQHLATAAPHSAGSHRVPTEELP